jgi:hypothetical protein
MAAGRPAPPPAGTTAALRGAALVAVRGAQEGVSLRAEQGARDNPALPRAPPDRVASRRTAAAAKVCKDARVDRVLGRKV